MHEINEIIELFLYSRQNFDYSSRFSCSVCWCVRAFNDLCNRIRSSMLLLLKNCIYTYTRIEGNIRDEREGEREKRRDGRTEGRRDGETERRRVGETERRRDGESERQRDRDRERNVMLDKMLRTDSFALPDNLAHGGCIHGLSFGQTIYIYIYVYDVYIVLIEAERRGDLWRRVGISHACHDCITLCKLIRITVRSVIGGSSFGARLAFGSTFANLRCEFTSANLVNRGRSWVLSSHYLRLFIIYFLIPSLSSLKH